MSRATRAESAALTVGVLTVLISVLAAYQPNNFPDWGAGLALLLVFGVTIAVGEWFQISAPGLRSSAPLATASAFGLCFTVEVPDGGYIAYAAAVVIAVASVATTIGVGARLAARRAESSRPASANVDAAWTAASIA